MIGIAKETFLRIRSAFPELEMNLDESGIDVELSLDIPEQDGLDFPIHLYLDNDDELTLCVGSFWNSWFPCGNPGTVEAYVGAVSGLITGQCRIVEHHRGRRSVRAELQRISTGEWETISTWGTLSLPWPRKTIRVTRNEAVK